MAAHGVLIRSFAGDGVLLRQILGGLDHSGDGAEAVHRLRALTPAIHPVVHFDAAGACSPAHVRCVVLDVAHAFDAAGNDDINCSALDHHCRSDDRLEPTAA